MGVWRIIDAVVTYLYFLLTPYKNDKTVTIWHHPLNVRSRPVPPLVDDTTYHSEYGVLGLVELIWKNARHTHYVPYYDGVARCAVTAVWHLRSEKTMHEIVVVEYTMSVDSGSDTRFVRFERFHVPNDSHRNQKRLRTVTGLDSVRISDSWDDVGHNYAAVQTLSAVPPGRLDILDVVALAELVGDTAQKYSSLPYPRR